MTTWYSFFSVQPNDCSKSQKVRITNKRSKMYRAQFKPTNPISKSGHFKKYGWNILLTILFKSYQIKIFFWNCFNTRNQATKLSVQESCHFTISILIFEKKSIKAFLKIVKKVNMYSLTRFHNMHLLTKWEGQMGKYWLEGHAS